jgi:dipeptidyl aminopeptidase/acylaminoacyl peptidase
MPSVTVPKSPHAATQAWLARPCISFIAPVALVVGAALAGVRAAEVPAPEPLPVETFFATPDLAAPQLAPSGRWLSVLVKGAGDRLFLTVVDPTDMSRAQSIAGFEDADIAAVHWVGDDRLVFSVVDRQVASGERRFAPGLFSIRRDGSQLKELVKLRPTPFFSSGRVGIDRRLDFRHKLLFVPQGDGHEVIVGELEFGDRGRIDAVLPKWLDIDTGRTRPMDDEQLPASATGWLFDAAGTPRVAVTSREGRVQVHWRAPGSAAWALLLDANGLAPPWLPHELGADGVLYVTSASGAGGTQVLAPFDFAKGQPRAEPSVVVTGFDFSGHLVREVGSGRTLGVRALTDGENTVWFDAGMKALQAEVDARLPGRINRLTCRRCDADDRVVLVESYSDRDPGSYLLWRGPERPPLGLGRHRKGVDPRRMAPLKLQTIAARDGLSLPVWTTQPAAAATPGPRPTVVLVHGGPWVRGTQWGWHAMPQFLASRGYLVIEPEFRGSTGFGRDHFRAGWRQWGRAMQDDVADAVRWAIDQNLADPKRVCIAGASYGGYATLMGLVRDPALYRCGAAWVAVTEPMRLLERSMWHGDDISDEVRQYSLPMLIGDPVDDAALLAAASPLVQAARIKAPVLLAYGELDRRVPLVHGKEMRDALKAAGNEPEWVVYDGEGHNWQKLSNQRDFARRLDAFLARQLR